MEDYLKLMKLYDNYKQCDPGNVDPEEEEKWSEEEEEEEEKEKGRREKEEKITQFIQEVNTLHHKHLLIIFYI